MTSLIMAAPIMKFSPNLATLTGKASSHRSSALESRRAARHISSSLLTAIILRSLRQGRIEGAIRVAVFSLE